MLLADVGFGQPFKFIDCSIQQGVCVRVYGRGVRGYCDIDEGLFVKVHASEGNEHLWDAEIEVI